MKEVILITGSSRGIGAATALLAARQGYAVCVNYVRDARAAGALCARIVADGGEAIAVQADASDEADVARLFGEIDARLGTLTALVNNVGVLEQKCRLVDMSVQRLRSRFCWCWKSPRPCRQFAFHRDRGCRLPATARHHGPHPALGPRPASRAD